MITGILICLALLIFALLGAPIFSLVGAGALYLFWQVDIDSSAVIIEMMRLTSLPALIAIPLFTFSGYVLAESKAPQRLLNIAQSLFGFLPGGIAIVSLLSAAIFTAFTGASGVTIIALGGLLYPMLMKEGYKEKFTLGLITTTGSLGLLFPPSLPIILYGLVAKISIGELFKAAFVPGVFIIVVLSTYAIIIARKANMPRRKFSLEKIKTSARDAIWEIPLPIIIIGGIYKGFFTASEASSIMAFYVILVEVFVYKDLDLFKDIPKIAIKSMLLVGAIFIMLGMALGFTNYMIDAQLPDKIFAFLHSFIENKIFFLIILNIFLLAINMIEIFSAIVIVVPIIVPIALQYGVDPIHLGIIFLVNLEIGYMTPPLGLNLFLSSSRFNKKVTTIYKAAWIFWLIQIGILILITYFPKIFFILR
ncbi:MAG: TRAP transporter large permease subunit [Elusimicrobiales bacterium]|nr:TRAP transporter large permease subunit [Elusimicrobiales bacterium]